MSLKFSVKLPLEVLSSLQAGPGTEGYLNNMMIANKAMLAAIKAIPYKVTPTRSIQKREVKSRVNVKTLQGRFHTFNILLTTTIGELKALVAEAEGVGPGQVSFVYRGLRLGSLVENYRGSFEDVSLDKCGVKDGSEVHMFLRVRKD